MARTVADVRVRLETFETHRSPKWGNETRFVIENRGAATAYGVQLAILNMDRSPVPEVEAKEVLPIPELYAGSEVHLFASFDLGDPVVLDVTLTWSDGRGDQQRKALLTPQHVL